MSRQQTAAVLWVLLGLFVLRVAGQALVGLGLAPFLPRWNDWYSGLLPYPWLVASQVLIIAVFAMVSAHVTRARGFFARPHSWLGSPLVVFGLVYAFAMAVRFLVLRTHGIPILFHFVLAGFLIAYGAWQRRASPA